MTIQAYDVPLGRGLDCFQVKDFSVDKSKACATGIFAAESKDRGGDILKIKGIKTENHAKNPISYWLHGYDYKDVDGQKPIGIDQDPEGNYTVKLLPDQGIAVCTTFFHQITKLASQICALTMEGYIKGQSIGYRELSVDRMYEDDRYIGTKINECELIETSWVPIPMNQDAVSASLGPDAIRSALSREWCGKSLHPLIVLGLSPYASPKPLWATGWSPEGKTMPTPPELIPAPPPVVAPKAKADDPPADEPEEEGVEKHGSKALRSMHKALSGCLKKCMKAVEPLDDDSEVKALGDSVVEGVGEHHEAVKAMHGDRYKDEEPLADDKTKDDDDAEGEMSDDDKKAMMEEIRRMKLQTTHQLRLLKREAS